MKKELSEEGRQLLVDGMNPGASALSRALPIGGADPHVTIVVVEKHDRVRTSLQYDRGSSPAYPPTLAEVVNDLTRIRGIPPDLVFLRSRGEDGRQFKPTSFGELLGIASASGDKELTLELPNDPAAAAGPYRIFSQGGYNPPGRARALVLYDARFGAEHNLMTPLLTDAADRWAHDALKQVHITSSIVDYYGDGDMIPVLRLTLEFFNPEKLMTVSQAVVRSCGRA